MPSGIAAQSIGGLSIAGQAIAAAGTQTQGYVETFVPAVSTSKSYNWSPPRAGYWKFVLWGAGDGSNGAGVQGASGAYAEKTLFLSPKDVVAILVGIGKGGVGADTTVTPPSGLVITAGGGNGSTGGVASGGDVNLNGSAPGSNGLGTGGGLSGDPTTAGAPAMLPHRGGNGAFNAGTGPFCGGTPGGGGVGGAIVFGAGGSGYVEVSFVRA